MNEHDTEHRAVAPAQRAAHLAALTESEMRRRVCSLASEQWSDHEIAGFMSLHLDCVRRWLADGQEEPR